MLKGASGQQQRLRQAWRIGPNLGSLDNLRRVSEAIDPPAPGQAQIAIKSIGLNFADVFSCLGLYKAAPKGESFVPGLEFAGEVLEVASPAEGADRAPGSQPAFKPGDRVMGVIRFGAYADTLNLDVRYLRPLPAGWTFDQGAAYLVQTITAAYGLFSLGALKAGQPVLVHSAAGGVGMQTLHILKAKGCPALGLVGSEAKAQFLRDYFADCGDLFEFAARPRERGDAAYRQLLASYLERSGQPGFALIMDSLGGATLQASYDALRPTGRHILFGAGELTPAPGVSLERGLGLLRPRNLLAVVRLALGWWRRPKLDILAMPGHNKGVFGFNVIWLYSQVHMFDELYDEFTALGLPPPHVGHVYPFDETPDALRFFQSGASKGKVVLSVGASSLQREDSTASASSGTPLM